MSPFPSSERAGSAVDEVTPLLEASNTVEPHASKEGAPVPRDSQRDDTKDDSPLPLSQIFLLCYARLVEPVAFFTIFPFINKMIWETGNLKEEDVGFYSGLIVTIPSYMPNWSSRTRQTNTMLGIAIFFYTATSHDPLGKGVGSIGAKTRASVLTLRGFYCHDPLWI
jgi:hypothetical protein